MKYGTSFSISHNRNAKKRRIIKKQIAIKVKWD